MKKVLSMFALLVAIYTPHKGSDPEHGQGAIERCDLRHREIARNVWIIESDTPNDTEQRLNEASTHGSFKVREATDEEKRKVASGEITLQK